MINLNIFKFSSIKARVTLFTLAIFATSIWSLSFYASRVLHEDMQQMLSEQQFSTVSIVASNINEGLEDRLLSLEKAAKTVNSAIFGNAASMQAFLEDRPTLQRMFNGGIVAYTPDGTVIADSLLSTDRIGKNYIDIDTVAAAVKDGKSTVGRPIIGKKLLAPVISMGVPIRDSDGQVIGGMGGIVNLDQPNFLDMILKNRYGKSGGYVLIASQHRLIVTATDKTRIMQTLPAPGINPLFDKYMQGFEGSGVVVDSRGLEVLSSAKQVPVAGWFLVARIPAAEAFAPIYEMQQRMVVATLLLSLLAGVLTWWILRRQLSPILSTIENLGVRSFSDKPMIPLPIASKDEIGQLIGHFNHLLAILRQREGQLKESEHKFRTLFEQASVGVAEIRTDNGQFLRINKRYCDILGCTADEATTLTFQAVTFPDDRQEDLDNMQALIEGRIREFSMEKRYIQKNGNKIWVHLTVSPMWMQGEIPTSHIAVVQDISNRKKTEEDNKTLTTQLHQAQKMEAIGTLAGGIAHDFNNILGAVLGYAEMAEEDTPAGSMAREEIKQVLKAGHRAKDLVSRILAFSRQAEVQKFSLQPALMINESIKLLRASLPTTIEMKQDIDPEAGPIFADPTQIHQIVMNLCTNAFHAMETTGGILAISLKNIVLSEDNFTNDQQMKPGQYIQLTIGDTGAGIPGEIKDKIFDPYFTTKEVGKGTGMGLAMIHGIVASCNGCISFRNQSGGGTVFQVLLPVIEDVIAPDIETAHIDIKYLGQERILFIDDEEMLAEMGKAMLERLGYRVTVKRNSIEALNTFQSHQDLFDLIITDQTMPNMTGIDLARRILQIRPDIPIILCTGYSSTISEEEAMLYGIKGFAMKPLAKKDIAELIRKVLDYKTTNSHLH